MAPRGALDLLIRNARIATLDGPGYGRIVGEDGTGLLGVSKGKIACIGTQADLGPALDARTTHDAEGAWLTPGLIDCHTHLVYAGMRADEFEKRLEGVSYEEIARAGGGIRSTVRSTRAASVERLVEESAPRLANLLDEGVTTVEIKSGYGLNLASERAMLRAARTLGERFPVDVTTTFLGAHAVPEEFEGRADDYVAYLIDDVLPTLYAEGLVDAVDAFCETIGFSPAQVERLFGKARELGLPVKLHAEQLSNQEGAALVARFEGLSADHLEWLSDLGIAAMRASGTVAVLLPGAFYFLRDTRVPPIEALRAAGIEMAIATDCNPGSAPLTSPLLAMNMACVAFRMTPAEALAGMTKHAARALGFADRGTLREDLRADLALWNVESLAELAYAMGNRRALRVRFTAGHTTREAR